MILSQKLQIVGRINLINLYLTTEKAFLSIIEPLGRIVCLMRIENRKDGMAMINEHPPLNVDGNLLHFMHGIEDSSDLSGGIRPIVKTALNENIKEEPTGSIYSYKEYSWFCTFHYGMQFKNIYPHLIIKESRYGMEITFGFNNKGKEAWTGILGIETLLKNLSSNEIGISILKSEDKINRKISDEYPLFMRSTALSNEIIIGVKETIFFTQHIKLLKPKHSKRS